MRVRKRFVAAGLTVAVVLASPLTVVADDGSDDVLQSVDDQRGHEASDVAEVDRPTDRPKDRPIHRPTDRESDRLTDREHDRCRLVTDSSTDRRCINDERPHDIDIRHLIYRLIHAGEWGKLVRLLHWLGWI